MLRKRIYALCFILSLLTAGFVFTAVIQSRAPHRDLAVLMNMYYRLKQSHPDQAQKALSIALQQDKNYLPALIEGSQWYLHEKNVTCARPLLERLHALLPNNHRYAAQLARLYDDEGNAPLAQPLFLSLHQDNNRPDLNHLQAQMALNAMSSSLPVYTDASQAEKPIIVAPVSESDSRPTASTGVNKTRPDSMGSVRMVETKTEADWAMQQGYWYDKINKKPLAYQYFQRATHSADKAQALRAENALTTLGGMQTKALPTPYFSEMFFTPFTQSRFGLTVRPLIARTGVEQQNRLQTKEYVFLRRTDDSRSENLGQVSQIYEDDVQVTGVGVQVTPVQSLPVVGFVEAGTAYDLVYRNRDRWRGDLRAGFMYYQNFGCKPAYSQHLKIRPDYYSEWYADMIYFSRYQNNVIGGAVTRQGIRALQYKSSLLNVYMVGRALADTRRVFYNNFAEVGPGIAFVPSNRFNLQLRFEHLQGMYIPAGSVPNPYGKYYTNNVVQLLFYVKL